MIPDSLNVPCLPSIIVGVHFSLIALYSRMVLDKVCACDNVEISRWYIIVTRRRLLERLPEPPTVDASRVQ